MSRNPTEHVQEEITHHASHHDAGGRWIAASATTAAIVAAFAAAAGALATSHETQSTLTRIQANDDWSYYQAKSIKSTVLEAKIYYAQLNKVEPLQSDQKKRAEYKQEMSQTAVNARELQKLSRGHMEAHEAFEGAATLFHIAIAIVAISVVARRKEFWYLSMIVGAVGILVFGKAYLRAPPSLKEEQDTPVYATPGSSSAHEPADIAVKDPGEAPAQKAPETRP